TLVAEALCIRPDAIAAAEAVEAAEARLDLSRVSWFRLLGLADGTSGRNKGRELGPATRFSVPIFNWNQGGVTRAEAELERAERNQHTVACQIVLDVHRSALQYEQAVVEMDVLLHRVRPELETAIDRAQRAYQEGQVTYLIVLETTRQKIDNLLREAQLQGDLRRFWAELERSVGKRLELSATTPGSAAEMNLPPVPAEIRNAEPNLEF
ncbi:MAG: TolC family protein, partial [Planctomycetota bacterium]|nr:TolC family protein [Planctomycetota bacterium]